jgi:hypothetical protein
MTDQLPQMIAGVQDLYTNLTAVETADVARVYSNAIVFRDPLHQVEGIEPFCNYLNGLSQNLNYCRFEFIDTTTTANRSWLRWNMHYSHPAIRRGAGLTLEGTSLLQHKNDKVVYQQDYYDMGAMLYEHLPMMGGAIRLLKKRLVEK